MLRGLVPSTASGPRAGISADRLVSPGNAQNFGESNVREVLKFVFCLEAPIA